VENIGDGTEETTVIADRK